MKFNINGKSIEVADDLISKAIEDKSESMEVTSDFVIRTPDEESDFKKNIRGLDNNASFEIARKDILKGLNIEVDGQHTSDDSAVGAIKNLLQSQVAKALTDAKIAPDLKVKEALADKATVIANMETLQGQFDTFKSETVVKEQNQTRRNTIASLIPDNVINRNDAIDIASIRMKTAFTPEGILHGIGADGQAMKDATTMNILPMKSVVDAFFAENQSLLKSSEGGAGGSDSSGAGGKQSLEDFVKTQSEAGNQMGSPEFAAAMSSAQKAGTLETV